MFRFVHWCYLSEMTIINRNINSSIFHFKCFVHPFPIDALQALLMDDLNPFYLISQWQQKLKKAPRWKAVAKAKNCNPFNSFQSEIVVVTTAHYNAFVHAHNVFVHMLNHSHVLWWKPGCRWSSKKILTMKWCVQATPSYRKVEYPTGTFPTDVDAIVAVTVQINVICDCLYLVRQ